MCSRSADVLHRPRPPQLNKERPPLHLTLPTNCPANVRSSKPGNDVKTPPTFCVPSASGPVTLPVRPMFQALPLSSLASFELHFSPLNATMTTTVAASASQAAAAAAATAPPFTPSPSPPPSSSSPPPSSLSPLLSLTQFPGVCPSWEELKYMSLAQVQAANHAPARLSCELAKLKLRFLSRSYLELSTQLCNPPRPMQVCNMFRPMQVCNTSFRPMQVCKTSMELCNTSMQVCNTSMLVCNTSGPIQMCNTSMQVCNTSRPMQVCNTSRPKLYPCLHCHYVTDRRNNLKRHVTSMHQACAKRLECCGVSFSTKASLRQHVNVFHHNGYSCPHCGRCFCRKALLKRHLSVHSGQKDYTCPHCEYATSHKSNLQRHKHIHARVQVLGGGGGDRREGGGGGDIGEGGGGEEGDIEREVGEEILEREVEEVEERRRWKRGRTGC